MKKLSDMKGKTAWITGGKRIGLEIARALAEQGVNIISSYRRSEKESLDMVRTARRYGVSAYSLKADVSSRGDVEKAVEKMTAVFPQIHILVNMSSVFYPKRFENIREKDWSSNIGAHILGTFWPVQTLSPYMPRGSHIINIADRTSIGKIYKGYLPYVVTKAAVTALTRALAFELSEKGILVNAIAPGPILRPEDIGVREWEKMRKSSPLKVPMSDKEAVEQFSALVLYLCRNTMATGHVYPLDFGKNL